MTFFPFLVVVLKWGGPKAYYFAPSMIVEQAIFVSLIASSPYDLFSMRPSVKLFQRSFWKRVRDGSVFSLILEAMAFWACVHVAHIVKQANVFEFNIFPLLSQTGQEIWQSWVWHTNVEYWIKVYDKQTVRLLSRQMVNELLICRAYGQWSCWKDRPQMYTWIFWYHFVEPKIFISSCV